MRVSCILGLFAMCLVAQATGQNCTREWPVLWPPCLFICQRVGRVGPLLVRPLTFTRRRLSTGPGNRYVRSTEGNEL
uniref:Putative salivary kunitz domain protein n=1 Tax=Ixodes ricinus TaxID=34613 RepID=A0A0K8RLT8_IXORI